MAVQRQYTKDNRSLQTSTSDLGRYHSKPESSSVQPRDQRPSENTTLTVAQARNSLESTYGLNPAFSAARIYNSSSSSSERSYSGRDAGEDENVSIRLPPPLRSDTPTREQLMQRFYDLHIGDSNTARRLFAFEALDIRNASKSATKAAMDTLCIAQIATTFQDAKLKGQARSMYSESLRYLGSQMQRLSPQQPPNLAVLDDVIGALHALTSCAFFTCCAKAEEMEWMHYTQSTLKILEVFGWDSLSPITRHAYYYNWKYRAFFEGLTRRTKISFIEPSDIDPDISANGLAEHAFDVPGLLWRADRFIEASKSKMISTYMILRLLTEIGVCMARLKQWYLNWLKNQGSRSQSTDEKLHSVPPRLHYRAVATRTFKTFKLLCEEHLDTFPLAYDFTNATHVRDLRTYCLCMIKLDQAIIDINTAFPENCKSDSLKVQLRGALFDAETSAADLCMLIPWCTQPQNMAFAAIHSFMPLHFASAYYAKQGKLQYLAWCREVTASLVEKYGIEIRYPD